MKILPIALSGYFVKITPPDRGSSMWPTIDCSDCVITSGIAYFWSSPKVGDIVVFNGPQSLGFSPEIPLMKRIVAEGGDVVHLKREGLYINGKLSDLIPSENIDEMFRQIKENNWDETSIELVRKFGLFGVTEPFKVPESHYFVLGDNIAASLDSRFFKSVPKEKIMRKATKVYWPPNRIRLLYGKDRRR